MIPDTNDLLDDELEFEEQSSRTYKLNSTNKAIAGYADELEAMRQEIYRCLNTERYQHIIYSWDRGIETIDLYGEPVSYVCPELERRIIEALTQDARILSVDAFDFDISKKGIVSASFLVQTIFGELDAEKAVDI